jgi:diguanylate cyclase (GGDEF)-like protein
MTGTINYIEKDIVSNELSASDIDDLTGLYRKNAIKKIEEDTINKAIAENSDKICGIIMVDIDNFKTINDNYGHLFGDKVIYKIATTLKDVVGSYGCCGRFGGDELCAFIDNVDSLTQLRGILRTLKTRVNNIAYPEYPSLKVTVSIGSATYPENGKSYDTIFKKADRALYIAKEKGRNRYVTYIDEIHGENLDDVKNDGNSSSYITDKNEFTNFLNEISQFLYKNGKDGISQALKMIYSAFSLERVQLYTLEDGRYKNLFKWGKGLDATIEYADFIDDEYLKLFENNMLIMNFVYNLEFTHPKAYTALSDENIFSAVQCIIKDKSDKPIGLCSFEHLSYKKMFSQNELLIYSYISNMLGVIL